MVNRVPIFGSKPLKRWRDNFMASPFEVKFLPIVFITLSLLPFSFLFAENSTVKIIHYVTMPGGCLFFMQAGIQSYKLVFGVQDLKNQIQYRWGVIGMLLFIILFNYFEPISYLALQSPGPIIKQVRFFKPIYNQVIPLFFIVILLIRLFPLTLKYYRLKKEKRLVTERAS
ncbi:hypothetical protein BEL04_14350 [Mucilaginibacter sp. PPCGB 2223]|nr:hypothetical protein BEL04_14350 [Mucilaginibacter sp. PPCGB 2223]